MGRGDRQEMMGRRYQAGGDGLGGDRQEVTEWEVTGWEVTVGGSRPSQGYTAGSAQLRILTCTAAKILGPPYIAHTTYLTEDPSHPHLL